MQRKIVLASGSPRRVELLRQLGLDFVIDEPGVEEELPSVQNFAVVAMDLASRKARAVQKRWNKYSVLIIAADTIVVKDGAILGKPISEADALSKIQALSGDVHQVLTGVCLIDTENGCEYKDYALTEVEMRKLSDTEIRFYVQTGEGQDKAGAYAIQGQGGAFVKSIKGSYSNVVGLPLETVYQMLVHSGFDFWYEVNKHE